MSSVYCSSSYGRRSVESTPRVVLTRGRTFSSAYSPHASPLPSSRQRYSSTGRQVFSSVTPASSVELELGQAARISAEFRTIRTQERTQLEDLNDRFAGFIERVHELEQQNRALQAELHLLRQRNSEPTHLRALYEQEARSLRAAVDNAKAEHRAALGERDHLEKALRAIQDRFQEEVKGREEAEAMLMEVRREADQVGLAKTELEKSVESLLQELAFLKKIQEIEVVELQAQIQLGVQLSVESETANPDLSGALKDIRTQYERLANQNMQAAEEWFRGKLGSMTQAAAGHGDAVRSYKDETGEYRRQLQARLLEIDACRGLNQSLEGQLVEMEENQSAEIAAMQDTIGDLERELGATKNEMTRYLKDYQDLLNVKMALDIEIAAYRKLLEGEETHFSVGMAGGVSSLYSRGLAGPSFTRPLHTRLSPGMVTSRLYSSSVIAASYTQHIEDNEKRNEEKKGGDTKEEEDGDGEQLKDETKANDEADELLKGGESDDKKEEQKTVEASAEQEKTDVKDKNEAEKKDEAVKSKLGQSKDDTNK